MAEIKKAEQIVSIAEAARLLGVSERTVYRRLKSGDFERVNLSDSKARVRVFCEEKFSEKLVKMSDNTIPEGDMATAVMLAELQARDAQIQSLIDSQREMNQTIQQLNQQIYELARLVLTSENEKGEKKSSRVRQWLNKWKPSVQERSENE